MDHSPGLTKQSIVIHDSHVDKKAKNQQKSPKLKISSLKNSIKHTSVSHDSPVLTGVYITSS